MAELNITSALGPVCNAIRPGFTQHPVVQFAAHAGAEAETLCDILGVSIDRKPDAERALIPA